MSSSGETQSTRRRFAVRYLSLCAGGLLLFALWGALDRRLVCAGLFLRLEGGAKAGAPAWLVHYREKVVSERLLELPSGTRARLYSPRAVSSPAGLVLAHGIHEEGIAEPRLRGLARALASSGIEVLTPELSELAHYHVTYQGAETIAEAARLLAARLGRERVMVFGISFGGGLALRAACDPKLRAPIERVIALGAHHDAYRVSRFFLGTAATGPEGVSAGVEPHPYGRVVLYRSLFDLPHRGPFTPDEKERVQAALTKARDSLDRASPSHCPRPVDLPVFLLHGRGDRVIPYTETLWNQAQLARTTHVESLISDAIAHAEYEPPSLWERLRLVHFMARASR